MRLALVALSLCFFVIASLFRLSTNDDLRLLRVIKTFIPVKFDIVRFQDVCPQEPHRRKYAKVHDHRPDHVAKYHEFSSHQMDIWNKNENYTENPLIHRLEGLHVHFIIWPRKDVEARASAWSEEVVIVAPGWVAPPAHMNVTRFRALKGDFAAFDTWFSGTYGHFGVDHLPTIAYMRTQVPSTTRFILLETPVARRIVQFVDPEFYENVHWVSYNENVLIHGSLTIVTPNSVPNMCGCCGAFDYMRQWIATNHPQVPKKRTVVFYSRGSTSDVLGERVMDHQHELNVVSRIYEAMRRHGLKEELVIFNGMENGKTMSLAKQFEIFRSAMTLIGPHGSGLGGNFLWTNPWVTNCKERVKLLEFIPGHDSAHVHAKYVSHFGQFRKWPFDHHVLFYTKDSTHSKTYIDLNDLDMALDAMWGEGDNYTIITETTTATATEAVAEAVAEEVAEVGTVTEETGAEEEAEEETVATTNVAQEETTKPPSPATFENDVHGLEIDMMPPPPQLNAQSRQLEEQQPPELSSPAPGPIQEEESPQPAPTIPIIFRR